MKSLKQKVFNWLFTRQWFLTLLKEKITPQFEQIYINSFAASCGLEDRNIDNRYDAMEYGYNLCKEEFLQEIENL